MQMDFALTDVWQYAQCPQKFWNCLCQRQVDIAVCYQIYAHLVYDPLLMRDLEFGMLSWSMVPLAQPQ
jgi:hypothetical protein